ncbi:hypothetical protein FRX31_012285 [Thalictrum thalictroides]|uniref:Uncharacterized protein n=1 Tax=Thalictrum thalictroides TaxID=46969 RepID=A0A7J6WMC9_THATH|nr:hypothetical protein FRX31_012285 [Thalictrum thalictroides]
MPTDLNIYVTTLKADEDSWGTYCPGMKPPPPQEYTTCLANLLAYMDGRQNASSMVVCNPEKWWKPAI